MYAWNQIITNLAEYDQHDFTVTINIYLFLELSKPVLERHKNGP